MPPTLTELFVNGDFEDPPAGWNGMADFIIVSGAPGSMNGWTGRDIEWGRESLYIPGGSRTNRVIEMDGNRSAITEIQQSFTVGGQVNAVLSFDMALRSGQPGSAGEGFTVTITDADGNVLDFQTYRPTQNIWETVTLSVPLDAAGTYTIRFTEIGTDNSFGAIIDNVSLLACFTAGTLIDTPDGPRRVEELRPGDLVLTVDQGPQAIRWAGKRKVSRHEMLRDPRLRPVTIAAGALGRMQPARDLSVSRQHRILRTGWTCELHFATPEVLVPAHKLVNDRSIRQEFPERDVTYVHILFDRHQIVMSEGLATESFYPCRQSLSGVEAEAQAELLQLFPELGDDAAQPLDLARPVVDGRAALLLA